MTGLQIAYADCANWRRENWPSGSPFAGELAEQPCPGEGGVIFGAIDRDAQDLGSFLNGQAHVISQLDEFGRNGVLEGEAVKRVIDRQELILGPVSGDLEFVDVHPLLASAMA